MFFPHWGNQRGGERKKNSKQKNDSKNKLDKFFAAKDKKKQKETKTDVQKDDDDDEVAKEVGIEFGITGDFSGRTIKLTKEGAMYVVHPCSFLHAASQNSFFLKPY